jgi:hypothetical protein
LNLPDLAGSAPFRAGSSAQNVHVSLAVASELNIGSSHWARHLPFEQRHQREKWRLLETMACGSIASPQSGHLLISVIVSMICLTFTPWTWTKKKRSLFDLVIEEASSPVCALVRSSSPGDVVRLPRLNNQ